LYCCLFFVFFTGRPARSAPMPVLFLLSSPKMGFSPRRGDMKREIWRGKAHRRSPCQIAHLSWQKCGNTVPKTGKIWNCCHKFSPRGASFALFFYEILSVSTRLQVAFDFIVWSLSGNKQPSYKHFSSVGAFSHRFSIVPSGETTDRIKKVRGCNNGT